MKRIVFASAATLAATLCLSGCIIVSDSDRDTAPPPPTVNTDPGDPRGTEASLAFSWRIDGRDPVTDARACSDAGVQFIRLTVLDGATARTFQTLQWDCNLGRYSSARPELRAGSFNVYFEAVAADGRRLSVAPSRRNDRGEREPSPERAVFVAGQRYDFDQGNQAEPGLPGVATNFATGPGGLEVSLRYDRAGVAENADCATARVARIRWRLLAPNNVAVEDHTQQESCAQYAQIRWETLFRDNYRLAVTAFDSEGATLGTGQCADLLVRAGTTPSTYACRVVLGAR